MSSDGIWKKGLEVGRSESKMIVNATWMVIMDSDVDVPNFHTAIKDNCQIDLHLTMERTVSAVVVITAITANPSPIRVKLANFAGHSGFLPRMRHRAA